MPDSRAMKNKKRRSELPALLRRAADKEFDKLAGQFAKPGGGDDFLVDIHKELYRAFDTRSRELGRTNKKRKKK